VRIPSQAQPRRQEALCGFAGRHRQAASQPPPVLVDESKVRLVKTGVRVSVDQGRHLRQVARVEHVIVSDDGQELLGQVELQDSSPILLDFQRRRRFPDADSWIGQLAQPARRIVRARIFEHHQSKVLVNLSQDAGDARLEILPAVAHRENDQKLPRR
jgi:hypothetical protein